MVKNPKKIVSFERRLLKKEKFHYISWMQLLDDLRKHTVKLKRFTP
jgi:hypothetical protein